MDHRKLFIATVCWILAITASLHGKETAPQEPLIVARENGSYLSLTVENNALVLRFLDADMNVTAPDAPRAMAFWRFRGDRNRQPMTLQGDALISPRRAYPPFAYTINISLLTMEDNDVTESHNFDMRHFQNPSSKQKSN